MVQGIVMERWGCAVCDIACTWWHVYALHCWPLQRGWTPLMEASNEEHYGCVQLLVKSGAHANVQNKAST